TAAAVASRSCARMSHIRGVKVESRIMFPILAAQIARRSAAPKSSITAFDGMRYLRRVGPPPHGTALNRPYSGCHAPPERRKSSLAGCESPETDELLAMQRLFLAPGRRYSRVRASNEAHGGARRDP